LVTFAITIKNYIPLKMNDKIKAKLKSGEYILTEKRHAKCELWKSFREIQTVGSTSNIRVRAPQMMFGFGSVRVAHNNILGLGPGRAELPSGRVG
jgi:hypothetical protein